MSSNNNDSIEGQPPAKRQRRSLGASDRVVLDVGGTKFITSASTLTTNSAYFAALLSNNWIESNNGEDEIFIDQDPVPFSVLLAYMRRGNIEVGDINTNVLSLAEFLGMERLLLAIKVRWYCNIGRGPVHTIDNEIASAFDEEHGGIMRAISSGLFQYFLKQNDIDEEKESATIRISKEVRTPGGGPRYSYYLKEVGKPGSEHRTGGLHCALNCFHLKGYTHYERQLKTKDTCTFSRRKHDIATMSSEATDVLIPNDNKTSAQERNGHIIQFTCVLKHEDMIKAILAPAEFNEVESYRSNPLYHTIIRDTGPWLEDNGFVTRADVLTDIFGDHVKALEEGKVKVCMFSRVMSKRRDDTSW